MTEFRPWHQAAKRRERRAVVAVVVTRPNVAAVPPPAPLSKAKRRPPPKQPNPYWEEAHRVAMAWLDEHGYPKAGDHGQAKLVKHVMQWLSDRDHEPGELTVRRYVAGWIEEYKRMVGASS